ncbi:MAG: triosephosphate isomerase, partial [Nitrospinae bacterium]|nr:triosephosphate isomerase [Nitrospinota bacterium]
MNLLIPDSAALAEEILDTLGSSPPVQVGIAPPFTALESVREALAGSGIALGGQNICSEPQGAFTGEISASMLKDAGCGFVILGHSERRQLFGETDATVNRRVKAALKAALS